MHRPDKVVQNQKKKPPTEPEPNYPAARKRPIKVTVPRASKKYSRDEGDEMNPVNTPKTRKMNLSSDRRKVGTKKPSSTPRNKRPVHEPPELTRHEGNRNWAPHGLSKPGRDNNEATHGSEEEHGGANEEGVEEGEENPSVSEESRNNGENYRERDLVNPGYRKNLPGLPALVPHEGNRNWAPHSLKKPSGRKSGTEWSDKKKQAIQEPWQSPHLPDLVRHEGNRNWAPHDLVKPVKVKGEGAKHNEKVLMMPPERGRPKMPKLVRHEGNKNWPPHSLVGPSGSSPYHALESQPGQTKFANHGKNKQKDLG